MTVVITIKDVVVTLIKVVCLATPMVVVTPMEVVRLEFSRTHILVLVIPMETVRAKI